jgi:hypothetical protein
VTTTVAASQISTTNSIDITANAIAGDLGVLLIAVSSGPAGAPTAPAGFGTAVTQQNVGSNQYVVIAWKELLGSETTLTIGNFTSGNRRVRFLRGTSDQSGAWRLNGTPTSAEADAVNSIAAGSITVAVANWNSSIPATEAAATFSNSYGSVNYERFGGVSAYREAASDGAYDTTCTLDPDVTKNLAIAHAAFSKGLAVAGQPVLRRGMSVPGLAIARNALAPGRRY